MVVITCGLPPFPLNALFSIDRVEVDSDSSPPAGAFGGSDGGLAMCRV